VNLIDCLAIFIVKSDVLKEAIYEPDILTSFQRSLDRHLTQNMPTTYSILRDPEYAGSRQE